MSEHPGELRVNLQKLAAALAHDAISGKDVLCTGALRGGGQTKQLASLDKEKLSYIKTVARTRVLDMSSVAFEAIWDKCRTTISKACRFLHTE